jgi:2-amino-4-hydroxy-6-hydroxymethyldihydropteridine diphosphokinase
MNEQHAFYLSIGSNIHPESNLPKAIQRLRDFGQIPAISNAWESHAEGSKGPNYLNAALLLMTITQMENLKPMVIRPIEADLGRVRSGDKNAPRTIDIDIMIADSEPLNANRWAYPFVIVTMSELLPDFTHPLSHKRLAEAAAEVRAKTWIAQRPEILKISVAALKT